VKPVLQALVLAERIYTDVTQKKIIAGTFNLLTIRKKSVEAKPAEGSVKIEGGGDMGCPSAYISLTDVVDGTEITLQFVNVSKNKVLFGSALKLSGKDRLATVEIVAPLPPLRRFVGEAGTYSFDVVWNGEILGSHRLVVQEEVANPEN